MNLDAASRSERLYDRRKAALLIGLACITFVGLTVAQLTRYAIGNRGALNVGDVAPRDIRAPRRATFVSEYETNRLRDLAEASVAPIFTAPDAQVSRRQLALARTQLDEVLFVRNTVDVPIAQRISQLVALPNSIFTEDTARLLLELPDPNWVRVESQVMLVLDVALRSPIQPDNLAQAKEALTSYISLSLNPDEEAVVKELIRALLVPNTNYDAARTSLERQRAREAVLPVERMFEANQVLIRSGQVLREGDIEALGKLNLRRPALAWGDVLGAMLFSALATALLAASMIYGHDNAFTRPGRNTAISALLLVVALWLTRWLLPGHGLLPYIAPLIAVTLCITIWSGTLPGVVSGWVLGVLVGLDLDKPLEFATYFACGSIIAVLALGRAERISSFARAGVAAGLMQAGVVLAFNVPTMQPQDGPQVASYLVGSLSGGLVAAALAPVLLYLSGLTLGITTLMQLIELARPSHPLLQQMLLQAPGTYHHSLMVANLAEQAAERIGADSLLTRVGAYYHDIGKLPNPHFFIENQLQGMNVHDQLDAATSAAILRNHVTDGLKLAKQYRLPARIQNFIAEHHGTTKMKFQYAKAIEAMAQENPTGSTAELPDPALFSYPGPTPASKATALVMLADGCEAVVRAKRPGDVEALDALIREILTERLTEHQLDFSHLDLHELEVIRQSFLDTLRGAYHPRIQYPQLQRGQVIVAATTTATAPSESMPAVETTTSTSAGVI